MVIKAEERLLRRFISRTFGGGDQAYYSGEGSHKNEYVEPYSQMIQKFIEEKNISKIVDLGCGDYNVASHWISPKITYIGIDIVQEMVDHHNLKYGNDRISFQCLDIVEDELPDGELCLIRQVLQHMSNEEVAAVLKKVEKYKYVIITEHVIKKCLATKYNVNKAHGNQIRIRENSGLYFDEPPFDLQIETLLEIPYGRKNEILTSVLIRN